MIRILEKWGNVTQRNNKTLGEGESAATKSPPLQTYLLLKPQDLGLNDFLCQPIHRGVAEYDTF